MQYLKPRQRQSDGRWDYTLRNDGEIYAVGYCQLWHDWSPELQAWHPLEYERHKAAALAGKFHGDGHETPEEARDCYRQYLLDFRTSYDGRYSDALHRCEKCGHWTTRYVEVDGYPRAVLCEEHATRQIFEQIFRIGDSVES